MWIGCDPKVMERLGRELAPLMPSEYAPERRAERQVPEAVGRDNIVLSHTLMPDAMFHAFAHYGAMTSPDLPLSRAQHEMIATVVSATNDCFY